MRIVSAPTSKAPASCSDRASSSGAALSVRLGNRMLREAGIGSVGGRAHQEGGVRERRALRPWSNALLHAPAVYSTAMRVLATLAICATLPVSILAQQREPILDVHMHALAADA